MFIYTIFLPNVPIYYILSEGIVPSLSFLNVPNFPISYKNLGIFFCKNSLFSYIGSLVVSEHGDSSGTTNANINK